MKRFRVKNTAAAVAMGVSLLSARPVYAGTPAANLAIGASVASNCTISTLTVAFGVYYPFVANATAALNGNGSITIACTKGSIPVLTLGLGANASGSVRRMANGAVDRLPYELYQPPTNVAGAACGALTTVWGTATGFLTTVAAPSKAARTYNVCGSIPGGADAAAGAYTDTVVATVAF